MSVNHVLLTIHVKPVCTITTNRKMNDYVLCLQVRSEEEAPDGTSEANDDLAAATGKMITVLEQEKTKAEVNA